MPNLVLSRKHGEAVVIRDRQTGYEFARVTLFRDHRKTRLAFDAPIDIEIMRTELLEPSQPTDAETRMGGNDG